MRSSLDDRERVALNLVTIHTDGSAVNNKTVHNSGHGGAGVVFHHGEREVTRHFGSFRNTTSARMEIFAIIKALELTRPGVLIKLFTDNQYCSNTINHDWYNKWITTQADKANMDLWRRFKKIYQTHTCNGSRIEVTWIKGHAKGKYIHNETADRLATKGRLKVREIVDNRDGFKNC